MSHFRKIDVRIWNDAKFTALSERGKLVFLMLLTHPMMTALGAMRGTPAGLAAELGVEPEGFAEAFREVLAKGLAEHDPKACLIALPNFLRYNPPESPNVVKAWSRAFGFLPECELQTFVAQRAVRAAEGLSKGFREAIPEDLRLSESREQRAKKEPSQGGEITEGTTTADRRRPTLAVVEGKEVNP